MVKKIKRGLLIVASLLGVLVTRNTTGQLNGKPQGRMEPVEERVEELSDQVDAARSGSIKFLLAGTYAGDFAYDRGLGATSLVFFRPHFYFLFGERFFWEGNVDFRLRARDTVLNDIFGDERPTTSVNLLFADLNILVNDTLTISVGQFMDPVSFFEERLHTNWVFRTAHKPLANNTATGLVPDSQVGVQFRGVVPVNSRKFDYSVWIGNGPTLDDGRLDPGNTGRLRWNNFLNFDDSLGVGVQGGFFPIPTLEVGSAFLWSQVDATEANRTGIHAQLYDVYLTYTPSVPRLFGNLYLYMEAGLSHVTTVDYGSGAFRNRRLGSYEQLSYRPTMAGNKFLENLEFLGRYDRLDMPGNIPQPATQQTTFGINYLIQPNILWKNDYVVTIERGAATGHAYLAQLAVGF